MPPMLCAKIQQLPMKALHEHQLLASVPILEIFMSVAKQRRALGGQFFHGLGRSCRPNFTEICQAVLPAGPVENFNNRYTQTDSERNADARQTEMR